MRGVTIRLGLFLAVTGILTLLIAGNIAQFTTADQLTLSARFTDANGVRVGDPVRISGVPVGKVTRLQVDQGKALVEMSVDAERSIPADSEIGISWLNLIGMRQLDITPGQAEQTMADGGMFESTRSVVDLARLADSLSPFADTLDPESVNGLLETIHTVLDGSGGDIGAIVANLEIVLGTLGERDQVITQMIDDYATLTDAMVTRDQQFRTMLDNLVALSDAYAGTEELLGQALGQASTLTMELDGFLDRNEAELTAFLDDFEFFVSFAADNTDALVDLLTLFPPGLESFFGVMAHGEYLRVNANCIDVSPPPCDTEGLINLTSAPVTEPAQFQALLLGRAGGDR